MRSRIPRRRAGGEREGGAAVRGEAAASRLCPRRPPFCVSFVSVHAETALACLHFPAPGECGLWIPHCFPHDRRSRQWNRGRWNEEGPAPPAAALPPAAAGALQRHLCWGSSGQLGDARAPPPNGILTVQTGGLSALRLPGRAGLRSSPEPRPRGAAGEVVSGGPAGRGRGAAQPGRASCRGRRWAGALEGREGSRGWTRGSVLSPVPSPASWIPGAVSPSLTSCGAPPGAALSCTVATRVESFK